MYFCLLNLGALDSKVVQLNRGGITNHLLHFNKSTSSKFNGHNLDHENGGQMKLTALLLKNMMNLMPPNSRKATFVMFRIH